MSVNSTEGKKGMKTLSYFHQATQASKRVYSSHYTIRSFSLCTYGEAQLWLASITQAPQLCVNHHNSHVEDVLT